MSLKKLDITNPTNEIHILRHFDHVDRDYTDSLIEKAYFEPDPTQGQFSEQIVTIEVIENCLSTKGSKFFPNIKGIANPHQVLKLIKTKLLEIDTDKVKWETATHNRYFTFTIEYKVYTGFKNLVHINELREDEKKNIKRSRRGAEGMDKDVYINTVKSKSIKPINTIAVGIADFEKLPFFFVTAYPGDGATSPDFPDATQSKQQFQESKRYWDSHVFVEQ